MRIVHRKSVGDDEGGISRHGRDRGELKIGTGEENVGIGDHGAEGVVLDHHRLALVEPPSCRRWTTVDACVVRLKRGAGANDKIERQPVGGVKSARCRLQIKCRQTGPQPVEMKRTGDMEGISDMLAPEHGSAAGKVGDQQDFSPADALKP